MPAGYLTRRCALLLPLVLAACGGGEEEQAFEPLRFNYLPPIQLNVAKIDIEQRFVPAGVPPDVSSEDPVPPVAALRAMAADRLQAFGTANRAVFAILDASMMRTGDVISGTFAVSLTILDDNGAQRGFAEARVQARHGGRADNLRSVLYDMTKSMMNDMNIEFEYQIHRSLKSWLTSAVAPDTPVEQAPLDGSQPAPAPKAPGTVQPPPGTQAAPGPAPVPDLPPAPIPPETPAYPPNYLQAPPQE
ncbi:MAG: hypothetical protein ACJ8AW_00175 [Rhodopila sp.]